MLQMLQAGGLHDGAKKRGTATNWRQICDSTVQLTPTKNYHSKYNCEHDSKSCPKKSISSPKFTLALIITIIIVLSQVFIVHYYLSRGTGVIFSKRSVSSTRADLFSKYNWLCYCYPYLNDIIELAQRSHVELVIVDPDFLEAVQDTGQIDKQNRNGGKTSDEEIDIEFSGGNYKSHQGSGKQKTIVHLAAINETSGGQPNLKSFYKTLERRNYVLLKYDDTSQTMPHEVYQLSSEQFDDIQSDAIRDLNHLERSKSGDTIIRSNFEVSKVYTEFISHIFLLNNADKSPIPRSNNCLVNGKQAKDPPFVVIHMFVLYNYEYQPDKRWIQPSLHLDELDRHKLLTYGVHSFDFKIPLEHYYIHSKRNTISLSSAPGPITRGEDSVKFYKLFEDQDERTLSFANNTYLHCKQSAFNLTGLRDGKQKMSNYLRLLDAAQPLKSSPFRTNLDGQMSIAFQFMDVFANTYGNFSYWLTGSTLLAYHKFCELVVMPSSEQLEKYTSESYDGDKLDGNDDHYYGDIVVNLELGLFADELNRSMLRDLSDAKMIGVTMLTDWRKPNSHISFRVRDCPNLLFHLYLYELKRDFYQYYFITRDNLTFNHKFRHKPTLINNVKAIVDSSSSEGHHVFMTNSLKLCWTRLDRFHPFRVPCDVHDHLRRIYVI